MTENYLSQILFDAFTRLTKYRSENSVLTEIKNSGELKNVRNDSLRKLLLALEPTIESVKVQENNVNDLQKLLLNHIAINGDIRIVLENTGYYKQIGIEKARAISKGNKSLLKDDYFKNKMIEYFSITLDLNNGLYLRLKNEFSEIVNKIDNEIVDYNVQ